MTNCINCGAVLTSNKCEYCGTIYENKPKYNLLNFASSYGISIEQAIGMPGLFENPKQAIKDAKEMSENIEGGVT